MSIAVEHAGNKTHNTICAFWICSCTNCYNANCYVW